MRPTLGPLVVRWIERFCIHAEGDFYGEPFLLDDFQKAFIWRLYEYDEETLRRIVRRALLILPKGCGKSELIAAICLAELAGPVSAFRAANGKVGGRMRTAPNIPVAAASYEQAERVFGAARVMASEGPLKPFLEPFDTEIFLKDRPGRMFRVAAVAGTNDGGLPTCFAADEIHEWEGNKARVHLVIGNSLAKRAEGLELNITTPDDAEPESLLGRMVEYGQKVVSGEVDDPSFLFVHYTASEHWNLNDPHELREAIREATPASWLLADGGVDRIAARLEIDKIAEHEFRRYHLSQFRRPAAFWLPGGAWEACRHPEADAPNHQLAWIDRGRDDVPDGTEIVLGFDGSYNNDSTALVGCTLDGYVFVLGAWERPRGSKDWRVPRPEIKAAVRHAFKRYRVVEMAADPPGWHREIDDWIDEYGDEVVLHFPTNAPKRMEEACSRFYTAVVTEELKHDGDQRLARHLSNAVVKETKDGALITKDGRNSPRKIDLAVGAVIAFERATWRREQEGEPELW